MAKYIEAVKSADIISEKLNIPLSDLVDVFAEIHSEDVEEVCRCEKCKFKKIHTCAITGVETLFCDYGATPVAVEPNHYCGYGERGEE